MASHIPTTSYAQKIFRTIEAGIKADASGRRAYGGLKGSLKYEKLPDDYLENDDTAVYATTRYIGPGFIWGSDRGYFEVHIRDKEVNAIYLVA